MPPLPTDSIHARACKLKCEKILTRPKRAQKDLISLANEQYHRKQKVTIENKKTN